MKTDKFIPVVTLVVYYGEKPWDAANCRINYNALDKGGAVNMISVFGETRMEGITQGRAEGITLGRTEGRAEGITLGRTEGEAKGIIETGYEFGLSEADILARLQKN